MHRRWGSSLLSVNFVNYLCLPIYGLFAWPSQDNPPDIITGMNIVHLCVTRNISCLLPQCYSHEDAKDAVNSEAQSSGSERRRLLLAKKKKNNNRRKRKCCTWCEDDDGSKGMGWWWTGGGVSELEAVFCSFPVPRSSIGGVEERRREEAVT